MAVLVIGQEEEMSDGLLADGGWYIQNAMSILDQVVEHWEQGVKFEALFPGLTMADLLPSPYDRRMAEEVHSKLKLPES
jgi:hypothetical protein